MRKSDLINGAVSVGQNSKPRVPKVPIENHRVLNEAYDYEKKVSFSRGMRVELDNCVMLFISGTASVGESGESLYPGDVRAHHHGQGYRCGEQVPLCLVAGVEGSEDLEVDRELDAGQQDEKGVAQPPRHRRR